MTTPSAGPSSLLRVAGRVPVLVWAALVVATVASYLLGGEHLIENQTAAAAFVLAVGAVKVWLVGLHFMELRHAPLPLRWVFEGYCAALFVVLCTLYVVL
ncbi:MAG: cytochrome C oxidase subunit IV family protein [Sporichthyaceae bacterium]